MMLLKGEQASDETISLIWGFHIKELQGMSNNARNVQ